MPIDAFIHGCRIFPMATRRSPQAPQVIETPLSSGKTRAPRAPGRVAAATGKASTAAAKPRLRMNTKEREQQILAGAIRFFAERGLDGQMRDLAAEVGITHPLLYHYFPTKRALIERVYQEVYLGRWKTEWETLLDDRKVSLEDKLNRFYLDYVGVILTSEWVRILIFSGLSDNYIPNNYLALLHERLFWRVVRETRRHLGLGTRAKPTERELELIMGMHGGLFYIGMRRWVYGQEVPVDLGQVVRDRVTAYVASAEVLFGDRAGKPVALKPGS